MRKFSLLLSIACVSLASSAWSQNTPSNLITDIPDDKIVLSAAEALAADAVIYAEAYGVTYEEALRRLSIMTGDLNEVASVETGEGTNFAGTYFDNGENFALVVKSTLKKARRARKLQVKTMTQEERRAARRAERREAKLEERSSARRDEYREARRQLRRQLRINDRQVGQAEVALDTTYDVELVEEGNAAITISALREASRNPILASVPNFQGVGVDVRKSELIIIVGKELSESNLEPLTQIGVPFRIEVSQILPTAIYGGLKFKGQSSENFGTCMTAFTALTNQGSLGVLTAEHCQANFVDDNSTPKVMRTVPETTFSQFGVYDVKLITNDSVGFAPWFEYDGTRYIRTVDAVARRSQITSATGVGSNLGTVASTRSGSFLCHLGQDYHRSPSYVQSCGEVVSNSYNNATGSFTGGKQVLMQNTGSGVRTAGSRTRGTLKCYNYDSGGPVFANNTAYGVVTDCGFYQSGDQNSTNPNIRAKFLIFTSIDALEEEGINVTTY